MESSEITRSVTITRLSVAVPVVGTVSAVVERVGCSSRRSRSRIIGPTVWALAADEILVHRRTAALRTASRHVGEQERCCVHDVTGPEPLALGW